ncbi:hypothetical protein COW36_02570 [bacterium (Candidatus Blackallbacteria) CG17_big_fil_post_rev_8_21_14_2_50_48_46]|uniref:Uncharacterized protein n=1 Tax=bacterium (Candidatus Blackallbacteria) CG17_big_fil_post_rev_8_21_14_2_50_48_46 TaxID=2014261 RepID=A0A2M7GA35_9BACT|nr:MAG: hypothetical protein COW64_12900 [bacterium (Candidatus Blackallbacteria) CG18_big_fil_WC_8_21_14_2_50_49_26]PIW19012.1 MAG: hypothetical protein COW36_02570 [bacterium (Candidatus Blackallbacteria) CG17_big_fil_post_rev_8_21_14_2_50_48_46]PIW44620.1 MAG: hypothetical protein COW20_23545 [bacterium (Candidatus Blackallbacteria) CG13_big_fil_rev_8_21_14_2_50_49_14]
MARILVAGHGSRGDIQPLLALAVGLQAAGHEIEMISPPDFTAWIQGYGIPVHSLGESMQDLVATYGATLMKNPVEVLRHMLSLIHANLALQHEKTLPLAEGFDLIVASSLQLSAFTAADYWQIPYRYLVYCPSLIPSKDYMSLLWPWPELHPSLHERAWQLEKIGWQWALGGLINRERKKIGLPAVQEIVDCFLSPHPLLAAYRELASAPRDVTPLTQIPALHLKAQETCLPPEVEDYLQAGSAPIYLGFGSMNDGKAEASTAAMIKLARKRKERFILSKGWGGLGTQSALPENIFLIEALPHDLLFPRLRAVIHHGGAGTTSAAARAGLPQQLVPHLLDQHYWAHAVHTRGLGPPALPKRLFKAEALDNALQRLLREDYYARAQALGKKLRLQNGVEQAVQFLEAELASTK